MTDSTGTRTTEPCRTCSWREALVEVGPRQTGQYWVGDQEAQARTLGLLVGTLLSANSPIPLTPPLRPTSRLMVGASLPRVRAIEVYGTVGSSDRRIVDKKGTNLFALERGQGRVWDAEVSIGSVACVHRSSRPDMH